MGVFQAAKDAISSIVPKRLSSEIVVKGGWEELRSQTVSVVANANPGSLAPSVNTVQALNKYRSWIYPCVNLISNKVASVNYYLYKEIGKPDDEEFDRILTHPVVNLLKRPNKFQSGRQMKRLIFMYMNLAGLALVRILRNGAGQPAELHMLYPHELVNIEMGNNTNEVIKSFTFAPQHNRYLREKIPFQDVLYFHFPHPVNPYLPCTPIQAMAHVTDLDLYLQVYEKDFFQNNARPDLLIIPDKSLSDQEAQRVAEGWMAKHRGPGKQHRPAVLSQNVKVEQLSMSAHDFEFLALSDWIKDHILASYGIPEAMLGLYESYNKASAIAAETSFVNACIQPQLELYEDVINLQLISQFRNTRGLEFKHESALPKDDEWELAKNQGELTMGLTHVNEIRKRRGQKPYKSKLFDVPWMNGTPVPGNDEEADKLAEKMLMGGAAGAAAPPGAAGAMPPGMEGAIPGMEGMVPPGMEQLPAAQGAFGAQGGRPPGPGLDSLLKESLRASKPTLSALLNAARGKRGGLAALIESHPELTTFQNLLAGDRLSPNLATLLSKGIYDYIEETLDENDKKYFRIYEENISALDGNEDKYIPNAERFFVQKGIEIADIVEKSYSDFVTKGTGEDIEVGDLVDAYKESARDFIYECVGLGYKMGFAFVGKEMDVRESSGFEEASLNAAGRFLDRSADLKVRSTKKALTKIIKQGIEEGWGADQLSDEIRGRFKEIGSSRAAMIARTELSGAVAAGLDASYEKINQEAGRIVVKETRLWTALDERVCDECSGEHDHIVKNYETGIENIEIPLHPNCRCVQRPVMTEENKKRRT